MVREVDSAQPVFRGRARHEISVLDLEYFGLSREDEKRLRNLAAEFSWLAGV